jgi:hypothetical protein
LHSPDDHEIRALFDGLRRDEAKRIPPYRRPTSAAQSSRPVFLRAITAMLLIAAVGILLLRREQPQQPVPNEVASFTWTAPTDFLLDTPQSDLLRTTPRIGAPIPLPTMKGTAR